MEIMERYSALIESGRSLERDVSTPEIRQSLRILLERARDGGRLPLEGAWRLDSEVVRELEEASGYSPPGGWRGVASLAAGCGVLEAHREAFEAEATISELTDWSSSATTRRLIEAFTCRLVPPTTAAGLFILLGLHPAWGVHLAHASNRRSNDDVDESEGRSQRERELFPDETFQLVRETVFGTIGTLVAAMRQFEDGVRYPVDALSGFVEGVCRHVRSEAEDKWEGDSNRGLAPFVGSEELELDDSSWRVIDFTTEDLIDSFLVPAGAARHFDDGTFYLFPGVLDDIRVGPFDVDAQHDRLNRLLTGDPEARVA